MAASVTYCDDCGEHLVDDHDQYPVTHLPRNVASANKGESAVLCVKCFGKLINQKV